MSHATKDQAENMVDQVDTSTLSRAAIFDSGFAEKAKAGQDSLQKLTIGETVKIYKKAIFWSLMVSMCVIMEGYDQILIGNFFAYPEFAKKFGNYYPGIGYQLTAAWQSGLSNASNAGGFVGVLMNGFLVGRFGYKRVVLGALVCLSALIFMTFFAPNVTVLCVGEVLCALPWGIFAASAPAYAAEVLPVTLRVFLTSYTNMCFIIGQLIAAGVLKGLVNNGTEWSYRIPFAIQWVWPVVIFPVLLFAPESPWHLVRKGKFDKAKIMLKKLQSESPKVDTDLILASIVYTNKLEEELSVGTSYWDCFKGPEKRRTEIACMSFCGQVFSGMNFAYNSSYFYQQIGLGTNQIYQFSVGGMALALFATILSWIFFLPRFGRRTLYIWGLTVLTTILIIIGILGVKSDQKSVAYTQAVLTLIWTVIVELSIGQLGWAIPAEIGSTRLRQKTVCLARDSYYIFNLLGVLEPYFMNPTEWNLKSYTAFFWSGLSIMTLVWAYFRLPETKDRSNDEIDVLFTKGISARKFSSYQVDAFHQREIVDLVVRQAMDGEIGDQEKAYSNQIEHSTST
ncbi:putative alpha-glucoside transport protein [Dipodascopsis uninucleata]